MNYHRTQNAIIKRWHGYLRRKPSNELLAYKPAMEDKPEETGKNKVDKKRKPSSD
jgi:hypothetical protein